MKLTRLALTLVLGIVSIAQRAPGQNAPTSDERRSAHQRQRVRAGVEDRCLEEVIAACGVADRDAPFGRSAF
jgi:hypothetical protein